MYGLGMGGTPDCLRFSLAAFSSSPSVVLLNSPLTGRDDLLRSRVDFRGVGRSESDDCGVAFSLVSRSSGLGAVFRLISDFLRFSFGRCMCAFSGRSVSGGCVVASLLEGDGERDWAGVDVLDPVHDLRASLREKLLVTETLGVCVLGVVAAVDLLRDDSKLGRTALREESSLLRLWESEMA